MKVFKRNFLVMLTAVFVILSSVFPASAIEYGKEYKDKPTGSYSVKFYDVPKSYWAFDYIGEMQAKGIINGYPNGYYYPDNYVERCEFAKIMVGAAGLRLDTPYQPYFWDVSEDDWFYSYVETAKNYLTGYTSFGQYYFRPNNYALREDIAVALVKLKGYDTKSADQNMLKTMFSDYDSISTSAKPYVAAAVERGLVSGYEDGTFRGQDSISRAEAAAMLWRAFQYGNDNKIADISDPDKSDEKNNVEKKDQKTSDDSDSKQTITDTSKTDDKNSESQKLPESQTENKKSYAVTTLAKCTISDSLTDFTINDNNVVYYINRSDNSLYKISTKSGSPQKITNLSKLKYQETETVEETIQVKKKVNKPSDSKKEEQIDTSDDSKTNNTEDEENNSDASQEKTDNVSTTDEDVVKDTSEDGSSSAEVELNATNDYDDDAYDEDEYIYEDEIVEKEIVVAEYSDFNATQVYYDKTSDKVWLVGYFKNKTNKDGQMGSGKFWYTLDADNSNEVITTYEFGDEEYIIGSLPNGQFVTDNSHNNKYLINPDTCKYSSLYYRQDDLYAAEQSGNKLFMFNNYNHIYTYDFSSKEVDEFETEFTIKRDKVAHANNSFYFWDISSGKITAFNIKMQKFRTLDIDTINDVELKDGGYITANGLCMMRVTSDEKFIFADKDAGSIRMLYKNK